MDIVEIVEPKINKYKGLYKETARLKYLANREAVITKNKNIYQNKRESILEKRKEEYQQNKEVIKLAKKLAKQIIQENSLKNL